MLRVPDPLCLAGMPVALPFPAVQRLLPCCKAHLFPCNVTSLVLVSAVGAIGGCIGCSTTHIFDTCNIVGAISSRSMPSCSLLGRLACWPTCFALPPGCGHHCSLHDEGTVENTAAGLQSTTIAFRDRSCWFRDAYLCRLICGALYHCGSPAGSHVLNAGIAAPHNRCCAACLLGCFRVSLLLCAATIAVILSCWCVAAASATLRPKAWQHHPAASPFGRSDTGTNTTVVSPSTTR